MLRTSTTTKAADWLVQVLEHWLSRRLYRIAEYNPDKAMMLCAWLEQRMTNVSLVIANEAEQRWDRRSNA